MRHSCPVVQQRAALVAVARSEGAAEPCMLCGELLPKRMLSKHIAEVSQFVSHFVSMSSVDHQIIKTGIILISVLVD